ncbi:GNAT family N-acetyltransferase [Actibacterium sp. 188UL27-1]|nr:GNAT family N-acetyltransferase [Actibacterium sp. 188UL27-1]
MAPTLQTDRLTLRMPSPDDWTAYRAYYTSARAAPVGGPKTPRATWHGFSGFWGHWAIRGFGRFTIVERSTDAAIGHVGPYQPDGTPETELSWTLWTDAAEGRGIAYEAATAARDWCYQRLGWTTFISLIAPSNARSIALATRLGAQHETTLTIDGIHHDLHRHPGPKL